MENRKRVVVTGIGIVSPFGVGYEILWENLIKGESAVAGITQFDPKDVGCQIAAEVKDFKPEEYLNKKELKRLDRFLVFSRVATKLCMEDSKLEINDENSYKIGAFIGSGIGGMKVFADTVVHMMDRGPSRISPFFIPMMISSIASGYAGIDHGLKGPNLCIVTACATGAHNIGMATDIIRSGKAVAMLAGGSEAAITPLATGGFSSMKALSFANAEPKKASRPFDLKRDGFVMGEGGAIIMLEELEHAKARNAKIYGEIVGFGMSSDAFHITQPHPEGEGAIRAMSETLQDAGVSPDKVDYINAHGTATPLGDIAETKAIKKVFGDHAYKLSVSSTKSMLGHLLGAAGAVEAVISLLAVKNNILPPTINLDFPDPECDLDYVPNKYREKVVDYAMSNSFGFGGQNAVLMVKKYKDE
jgi:3-oxoacyl-[acyl-carrier-protein] synthase II